MPDTNRLAKIFKDLENQAADIPTEVLARKIHAAVKADCPMAAIAIAKTFKGIASAQSKFRKLADELTAPPFFPATFIGIAAIGPIQGAIVRCGNGSTVVRMLPEIDSESLRPGDEVYLNHERNLLVERAESSASTDSETATFVRSTRRGKHIVRCRDREHVVLIGGSLEAAELKRGDTVLFDPGSGIISEVIEPEEDHAFFLEEVPKDLGSADIGGQTENLEKVLFALRSILSKRELADKYGLAGHRSILISGPPGTGKTLITQVAASILSRETGKSCIFANVKPSQFESAYVGETQRNIREFFGALRRAAKDKFVVVFFDEVEGIGRIRGGQSGHHSDKFLAALLAEIEGFEGRDNIAMIAATNRPDLLDPALHARLSEIEVEVRRPDLTGAREIFAVHVEEGLPVHPNGSESEATRKELIETAVSQFYAPNGDNEVSTIKFQDGKQRTVRARELISGRVIKQVSRDARMLAMRREDAGGESGVRREDIDQAVGAAIEKMRTALSVHNCHAYLSDLPQDVTVVSVEPVANKLSNPNRYRMP